MGAERNLFGKGSLSLLRHIQPTFPVVIVAFFKFECRSDDSRLYYCTLFKVRMIAQHQHPSA